VWFLAFFVLGLFGLGAKLPLPPKKWPAAVQATTKPLPPPPMSPDATTPTTSTTTAPPFSEAEEEQLMSDLLL